MNIDLKLGKVLTDLTFTFYKDKMPVINNYMIFPKHLNAAQTLFGGQLMAWMDEAAATYAITMMSTDRIVTACFNKLDFLAPAHLGDLVIISCSLGHIGNTSLEITISATKKSHKPLALVNNIIDEAKLIDNPPIEICRTSAVFVALNEVGKPIPWNKARINLTDWENSQL